MYTNKNAISRKHCRDSFILKMLVREWRNANAKGLYFDSGKELIVSSYLHSISFKTRFRKQMRRFKLWLAKKTGNDLMGRARKGKYPL